MPVQADAFADDGDAGAGAGASACLLVPMDGGIFLFFFG